MNTASQGIPLLVPAFSHAVSSKPPLIPVLHVENVEHAEPLLDSLERGGIGIVEVTLRSACALTVIERMRKASRGAIIGAGTLTKPEHFRQSKDAGAQFLVSPALSQRLGEAAVETKLPYLPGVCTPTEVLIAREIGLLEQKFFPADLNGGINWIRHVYPLFPDVRFCPTGGISISNAKAYLNEPNIFAVGGVYLCPRGKIESQSWDEIAAIAAEALANT
jgi:2-dehydro-3-deoxyphosphogluconate aldolase/(4S)-4-hydroxy-2-oxoglutarate aldolase